MTNSRHIAVATPILFNSGAVQFYYADEAHIQTAMARLATAFGWRVQTEVHVPGWGRLDMVLHSQDSLDDYGMVLEFKHELTKLSTIRKSFQQADGYHRWLTQTLGRLPEPVLLAAGKIDWDITNDIAFSYRESVTLATIHEVADQIRSESGVAYRIERARKNAEAATASARLAQRALAFAHEDLRALKRVQDRSRRARERAKSAS